MISIIQNFGILAELMFLYLPLMFGAYLAISLMQIPNLGIESALLMGALTGSIVSSSYASMPLGSLSIGLLAATAIGALVGIATGFLHVYGKLSHLLSSIVIIGALHGISLLLLGGSHMTLKSSNNPLQLLAFIPQYPALPMLMIVTIIISSIIYYFLKTNLGVSCAAYGDNPQFLINHKLSSPYIICGGLGIANALAGISGYLIAQNNGFIDTGMGTGIPLLCITALMLGKAIIRTAQPINFALPCIGTAGYFILQSLLLHMGFGLHYFPLIQALALTLIFLTQKSRNNLTLGV